MRRVLITTTTPTPTAVISIVLMSWFFGCLTFSLSVSFHLSLSPSSVPPQHPGVSFPLPSQQQEQHLQLQGPLQGRGLGERVCRRRAQHGGGERRPARLPLQPVPPQQLQRLPRQAQQHGGLQRGGVAHRTRARRTPTA